MSSSPDKRFSVLGLGAARSKWFSDVASWSTSGAMPVSFIKCVSAAEVRQRLKSLNAVSALLVEAGMPGVDADLIEFALDAGVPIFVVSDDEAIWTSTRATQVLPRSFSPKELLDNLDSFGASLQSDDPIFDQGDNETAWSGKLIAVCGSGGTGVSTVSIALAQAFGQTGAEALLLDATRNAEQAMLHDSRNIVPSIEELTDACRSRRVDSEELRSLTFAVPSRNYRLMLGMRRPTAWAAMSQRAIEASLTSSRRAFEITVADVTGDFEGESKTGSRDVEDRNALARLTVSSADAVVVVGSPGMKGTHSLTRLITDVLELGVPSDNVIPVINRALKSGLLKSEMTKALVALLDGKVNAPLFLPERNVERALRENNPIPSELGTPIVQAVVAMSTASASNIATMQPQRVTPGSLGIAAFDQAG